MPRNNHEWDGLFGNLFQNGKFFSLSADGMLYNYHTSTPGHSFNLLPSASLELSPKEHQPCTYNVTIQTTPNYDEDDYQCKEVTCAELGKQICGYIKELLDNESKYLAKLRLFPLLANSEVETFGLFNNMKPTIEKYMSFVGTRMTLLRSIGLMMS